MTQLVIIETPKIITRKCTTHDLSAQNDFWKWIPVCCKPYFLPGEIQLTYMENMSTFVF